MTPMIDILLVLIIIFMVITPLTPRGLGALLPQTPAPDAHPPSTPGDVVITVEGDGTVHLNAERVDLARLHERLVRLFETRGNSVVFVLGGKDLYFRQIAEVIDIAKGAGIDRIGLMTQQPPRPL